MPFRLTNQGEYAIRLMVYLASRRKHQRISAKEIAEAQDIPHRFLRNIVSQFAKQGFISAYKGKGGGLELASGAENLSLLEIIEAVEGPIYLNVCMQGQEICQYQGECAVHGVWHQAQDAIQDILGQQRLKDLANHNQELASRGGAEIAAEICGHPSPGGHS
jgi:Rrf2 family protein